MSSNLVGCPNCSETIVNWASQCQHCGEAFEPPEAGDSAVVHVEHGPNSFQSCMTFVGLGVLGLVVLLTVACTEDIPPEVEEEPASQIEISGPAIPISELVSAYAANEAAAQMQYGDRLLLIEGTVSSIELDFEDLPDIGLVGDVIPEPNLRFMEGYEYQAAMLAKGDDQTFVCGEIREFLGSPRLRECQIVTADMMVEDGASAE